MGETYQSVLQVEFTESLTMMSGLFAVIVLSVLTGMSHMMVIGCCLYCASQSLVCVGTICP